MFRQSGTDVTVGDFALRAIREKLDRPHGERTRPAVRDILSASPSNSPSEVRT